MLKNPPSPTGVSEANLLAEIALTISKDRIPFGLSCSNSMI